MKPNIFRHLFFGCFTGKVGVQHYPGQIGQQAGVSLAVYGGQSSETQVPERTVSPVLPDRFKINEVGGNQPDLETVVKLDIGGFGSAADVQIIAADVEGRQAVSVRILQFNADIGRTGDAQRCQSEFAQIFAAVGFLLIINGFQHCAQEAAKPLLINRKNFMSFQFPVVAVKIKLKDIAVVL